MANKFKATELGEAAYLAFGRVIADAGWPEWERLNARRQKAWTAAAVAAANLVDPPPSNEELGMLRRIREEVLAQPGTGEGPPWPSVVAAMIDEVLPRDPGDARLAMTERACVTCGLSKQTASVSEAGDPASETRDMR